MNEHQFEEMLPTRRTLLSRLKDWNDQENWRVFFDTYWYLIYMTALKAGLTDAEAQDVVQETVISVMKNLRTSHHERRKGSFKGWLLQLTRWRIADQLRNRDAFGPAKGRAPASTQVRHRDPGFGARQGRDQTSTRTGTMDRLIGPAAPAMEAAWDQEWEANLLEAAIARVKKKVDPKQYQIFDLLVFKKWPAAKVARFLRINIGRVYLAKHRVVKLMKQEVAHLRAKPV